jgi:hypothetical protein
MKNNVLIILGLLDLFSFSQTYKVGLILLDNFKYFPLMNSLEILLILSFMVSGVLSIMRKKIALVLYYFQMPLRLTFVILTFGFLINIFGFQFNSIGSKVMFILTFLLEIARLIFTIMIHKREF